jgi:hypothetical protein
MAFVHRGVANSSVDVLAPVHHPCSSAVQTQGLARCCHRRSHGHVRRITDAIELRACWCRAIINHGNDIHTVFEQAAFTPVWFVSLCTTAAQPCLQRARRRPRELRLARAWRSRERKRSLHGCTRRVCCRVRVEKECVDVARKRL